MDIRTNPSYAKHYPIRPRIQVASDTDDNDGRLHDAQLIALLNEGNSDKVVQYLNCHAHRGLFLYDAVENHHIDTLIKALEDHALNIGEVVLCNTNVGNANVLRIIDAFTGNKSLKITSISFENCGLDSKGAQDVVQRLKYYGPLKNLSLAKCHIGPGCVPDIIDLVNHHDLHYLSLAGNHLGPVAQMPIRLCVSKKCGTTAHYCEKKLARRYDACSRKQLPRNIQKEVEKFHIRTFLLDDGLPLNDDDEMIDIALFCAEHEPDALPWLYEHMELCNKTVLKPSKEFLAKNAARFDQWHKQSPNCLFFAHVNKDAPTLLSKPKFVDEKNPALGCAVDFNACMFAHAADAQKANQNDQQSSGDIFILVLAAFPERGFEKTDAAAADTELLLKPLSTTDKAAVFEIWKAMHLEWVDLISQNRALQQSTMVVDFPLDVQGKILANIVDAYPITQAAALFDGLSSLMETVRQGREAAMRRDKLLYIAANKIAQLPVNEQNTQPDEKMLDAVPLTQGVIPEGSQTTRKRKLSGGDASLVSDTSIESTTKKSKSEQPANDPLLAPQ